MLKRYRTVWLVACGLSISGAAVAGEFEFVGLSASRSKGTVGILGMTRLCQRSFSGSRVCTSEEVLESTSPVSVAPEGSNVTAGWVLPTIVGVVPLDPAAPEVGRLRAIDASGITGHPTEELACHGWQQVSGGGVRGLAVGWTGTGGTGSEAFFFTHDCEVGGQEGEEGFDPFVSIHVACCAPKPREK